MSLALGNIAITQDLGERPAAFVLRQVNSIGANPTAVAAMLLSLEGSQTPLGFTLAPSFGLNIGARARFAGMEGETPLTFDFRQTY